MSIDTNSLTQQEKLELMIDLKLDLFDARPVVRVWETPEHPFYPGRFIEGLVIELDQQPYVILRIVRGYDLWNVYLAEPDDEERQWYATQKERDICPTCGYYEDDMLEHIKALHHDMAVLVHTFLNSNLDDEASRRITDEMRTIDSQLWTKNEAQA